jgi:signal transduction histidine kinase
LSGDGGEVAREGRQAPRLLDDRLAPSEDVNRAVLDSLPAHVAVLDRDGRIIAVNRAWRQFEAENGGAAESCGVGCNYLRICRNTTGDDASAAARVAEGIEQILRGRAEQFTYEYPCHAPHEPRWFLLNVTPLLSSADTAGGDGVTRLGAVVSHLNITERKLSEEQTRQRAVELAHMARALKRTNEELDHFAYITSHDLRAPLRGIANLSRWIEEDMGDRFTPEAHKQMEVLRGRVHRMEAMIDGILEFSRVGRVNVPVERIDVRQLLDDVIDLLAPPPRFTIEIGDGMPVVEGHKVSLQQVFMNLIGNALKYHDKPVGRIVVGCRQAGELLEFSVADDGPGIEPRYFEKIFVIFQTLQPRDKVEGTGVGLSVVKKIVEGEGGTITVESDVGRGSTFRFTWPRTVN